MIKNDFSVYKLSKETLTALKLLGYEKPTEVQAKVINLVLQDRDIIVKAQTGSGKTAAFAIPLCEKIELEKRDPQVLVLTPTRELAVQVKDDFSQVGRYKKIRCSAIFGRQPMELQKRELKQRVHVIVGTPGRTYDHIQRQNINLDEIKYLVVDEADKLLDMGFFDQVETIIKLLPKDRSTMLFSATFPDEIGAICNTYMNDPSKIVIESQVSVTEKIKQYYYEANQASKINLLKKVIYKEQPQSCIIFCNTRDEVESLAEQMKKEFYFCEGLHGGMEQGKRLKTIQRFKRGEFYFLIATDVAARGIHIDDVTHVINYDIPNENEDYVHRIGRTGRVEREGVAITLAAPEEVHLIKELAESLHYEISKVVEPTDAEVIEDRRAFLDKLKVKPQLKKNKTDKLNKPITRIRINAGKNKKMRPGDIVGAITNIEGINADDIGIIDVQDTCSYVEILGKNGDYVASTLQDTKIKGKIYTVKKVRIR